MGNEGKAWNPEKIVDLAKRTMAAASASADQANQCLGLVDVSKTDPKVVELLGEVLASVDCLVQVNRYLISLIESPDSGKV